MFRFLKNHLQGACFALLKLQVLIYIYYLGGVAAWFRLRQSLFVVVCYLLLRLI